MDSFWLNNMDVFIRVEQRQGEPLFLFVSGIRYQVSSIGYLVLGIGYRVSGIGYRVSGIGYRVSGIG